MFLLLVDYKQPLNVVDEHLEAHVQFLDKYYRQGRFIFSGRRNPRTGGVILVRSNTIDEVQKIIKEDPFYQHDVADYSIIEFTPTKYHELFKPFV